MTATREAWFDLPEDALLAALDRSPLAPEQLRAALAHPRLRAACMCHLQDRLARTGDPQALAELAGLLPSSLTGLTPALQIRLARLYMSLWTCRQEHVLPDWRADSPEPAVALAWLQLELAARPAQVSLAEPLALAALRGLAGAALLEPAALLRRACGHADAAVQREGLRLLDECLQLGALAPALAGECLVALLTSAGGPVLQDALDRLAAPWARGLPCPRAVLLPLLAGDDLEVALAAVRVAAVHDLAADLRALAEDDSADPRVRVEAFARAMAGCERDALPAWLALATTDIVLFGSASLQALRALHRRAIFVGDAELPALLELATGDHLLDLDELAALCFTARKPLLRRLADIPADDPRWHRLLPLLCALDSDEVPARLHALLAASDDRSLRRRIVRELGPRGDDSSEPVLLALLVHEPAACIAALRWRGAEATVVALSEGLGLDDERGVRPHLCPVADEAAALLWHLVGADSPVRRRLCARLRLAELPLAIRRDLEHPPARIDPELLLACAVAAAGQAGATNRLGPPASVRALELLGRLGGPGELALVRDLLRRVVSEVVAGVLVERDREALAVVPGPVRPPEAERRIPEAALQAVRGLGERLYAADAVRPVALLAARGTGDAGARVLAELLLDLDDDGLDPEARALVLRALVALPGRQIRRHLHRHLRDPDPRVRAAAVTCLSRHVPDDLCATLVKLAEGDDLPTARQALLALAEARATAAAPTIAAWLEHPNMNLRKTAAEALLRAGAPEVVPALVRWLGAHDNPGLRAALIAALGQQLGAAVVPTLIAALDGMAPGDPPARRRLWLCALDRRLDVAAVVLAARRGATWIPELLALLVEGGVQLRHGGLDRLAALLQRHGLHHGELAVRPPAPLRPAVRALRDRGLHDDVAHDLLKHGASLEPAELAIVRPYLRDWLLALPPAHRDASDDLADRSPAAGALDLVLQLFAAGLDARELAHCAAAVDALAARLDDDPREPLLALLDAVLPHLGPLPALRLAEHLRASRPRPNLSHRPWLARLRSCGAVLVRADLGRALHDCAGTSDPLACTRAVLRDAFPALDRLDPDARTLRDELAEALRVGADPLGDPRLTPALICDLYPDVPAALRGAWLDRLLQLQPLDVDHFQPPPVEPPRHLPPLRSAAALAPLLERLARPEPAERERAADLLLAWPAPAAPRAVLAAYLEGQVRLEGRVHPLAASFAADHPTWMRTAERDTGLRARIVALHPGLAPDLLLDLAPALIRWWTEGEPPLRRAVAEGLRRIAAARLLPLLEPHLRAGEWSYLELLASPGTLTPAWRDLLARAPDPRWHQPGSEGPLAVRDRPPLDLDAVHAPLPAPAPAAAKRTVAALRAELPTADPESIRQALKDLSSETGEEWLDLLEQLVGHASPRVRLQAHRLLRTAGERERYLRSTCRLLDDPDPNIQRGAIRAVSHAAHAPAVAPLIARLADGRDPLHREVVAALRRMGPLARDGLTRAARDARPDRRSHYEQLLATIAADLARKDMSEAT